MKRCQNGLSLSPRACRNVKTALNLHLRRVLEERIAKGEALASEGGVLVPWEGHMLGVAVEPNGGEVGRPSAGKRGCGEVMGLLLLLLLLLYRICCSTAYQPQLYTICCSTVYQH